MANLKEKLLLELGRDGASLEGAYEAVLDQMMHEGEALEADAAVYEEVGAEGVAAEEGGGEEAAEEVLSRGLGDRNRKHFVAPYPGRPRFSFRWPSDSKS